VRGKIFTITGWAILGFFALTFSLAAEETEEGTVNAPVIAIEQNNTGKVNITKAPLVSGSIQMLMGVLFGKMTEFVYIKGIEQELSRLEWEEHFVPYLGSIPGLKIGNFFINARMITAIPLKAGNMRDYDYMKILTIPISNTLTNFSEHDSMLERHFEVSPSAGWTFQIGSAFLLSPYAGLTYRSRKWTAMNGYYEYPPGSKPITVSGSIITYEDSTWFPTIGIIARYDLNTRFAVGLKGACYPYLNVKTTDTHILKKTVYYDKMSGGWGAFGGLELSFKPLRYNALTFKFEAGYEGLFPPKGITSSAAVGGVPVLDKAAQSKMESNLWWISLGISLSPSELWR